LETLEPRFEDMKENYERLSKLLRGEHLFDSEKFRTAIQNEVKNSIGYYWPSLKSDMKGPALEGAA
jgi:cytochrome c556